MGPLLFPGAAMDIYFDGHEHTNDDQPAEQGFPHERLQRGRIHRGAFFKRAGGGTPPEVPRIRGRSGIRSGWCAGKVEMATATSALRRPIRRIGTVVMRP